MTRDRKPDPPEKAARPAITEEAKLFIRTAAFGVIVGAGYGVLTGEPAGVVLLLAFGLASAVAAIAIILGSLSQRGSSGSGVTARPVGAESERAHEPVPSPGWAPLIIAIGLGGVGLGAAFGPWLGITGLLAALAGAKAWLDATNREADEARIGAPPGTEPADDPT